MSLLSIRQYLIKEFSTSCWILILILTNILILVWAYPPPQYIGDGRITWRGVVYTQSDTSFICKSSITACIFQSLISLVIAVGYPIYPVGLIYLFITLLNKWIYFLRIRHAVDSDPNLLTYSHRHDNCAIKRDISPV
ncbi:hypothetical protein [Hubei virga-like virus 23]|uniref:Uncharacterized protein n=1 Tax=Riboviria sp. TaxID=2585031 RepID=A0A8B0RK08_9VIRU|nr:hypothetical protein [Hubei virga-like virus 23]APG77646.1 hypothetical protein [Hubei virga-like virus 23]QTW97798.1 hypothetical protein [Riboviria sp.]